jgi:ABC-type multidrug transport system ATPase subunit
VGPIPTSPAPLHVDGLTKRYGRVEALSGVSFDIRSGEILGLIGPNGSGKTTLFECLAGFLTRDAGTVRADGRALQQDEVPHTLFYLPDGIAPWPQETVSWALAFVARLFDVGDDSRRRAVDEFDLAPLGATRIRALSKGQRKRVLLALGSMTRQPYWLIDEPFDGLDLRQTREVAAILRRHAAAGRTLLLSIHQIADAEHICDRFVLLSSGRVRGAGTLAELRTLAGAATLEEVFLALT